MSVRSMVFASTFIMGILIYQQVQRQREWARSDREFQRKIWELRSKRDGVYICGPCATGWLPGDCMDQQCQAKHFN